jgi:transcriptional regulator
MTTNNDIKQQFITLRAKGYSLTKIAEQIGKCRQTLSNWNSELQEEIENSKAIELEALFEECFLTKENRIKTFSQLLEKINKELDKRDFKSLSDDKLVDLKLKINQQLQGEYFEPKIKSESELNKQKSKRQLFNDF